MEMLRRCVSQISTVLKREEERTGYMTEQCRTMFAVREKWLHAQHLKEDERPSHNDLSENLLSSSSLARELGGIYDSLARHGIVLVKLGGWTTLSLSLDSISTYPSSPIRPYQTLLITNPSRVPPDSSPDLLRFVGFCKPSKSFQDMQIELNVPLSQIFRMAAHLMYWKIGKIVSTMTTTNVYCIDPKAKITGDLARQFQVDFPSFDLLSEIERFGLHKPLKEHLAEISMTHKQFSDVLVWLLRHNLLMQLFMYLVLIIPESFAYELNWEQDILIEEESELQKGSKVKLSETEKSYIDSVTAAKTSQDLLFIRLCNYAHGGHHLDEIVWRENLTHESVSEVLQDPKYAALTQLQHERRLEST